MNQRYRTSTPSDTLMNTSMSNSVLRWCTNSQPTSAGILGSISIARAAFFHPHRESFNYRYYADAEAVQQVRFSLYPIVKTRDSDLGHMLD